jgi:hypothetical protein
VEVFFVEVVGIPGICHIMNPFAASCIDLLLNAQIRGGTDMRVNGG